MPRVKKAITQISAATTARMNSHLITTTARTIPEHDERGQQDEEKDHEPRRSPPRDR